MLIFFNIMIIFIVSGLSILIGLNTKSLSSNHQGIPLGLFLSIIFSITIVWIVDMNLGDLEADTSVLVWLFSFLFLFITGLRLPQQREGIEQNYSGLPKFLGRKMENLPVFQEGIYWWIWSPFGEIDIYDIKVKTLRLNFGQYAKEVTMPDGTTLQEFKISIHYRIISDHLYNLTNISDTIENYLEEITYDGVRNAILMLCNSKTKEELQEDYHGLYALVLTDVYAIKRLKQLIKWGIFFPTSTDEFLSLKRDKLYIQKVKEWKKKKREESPSFDVSHYEFQGDEFPILSPKELKNLDINLLTKGVIEKAKKYSIEILEINIISFELPQNMQRLIDEKNGKILKVEAELKHKSTTAELKHKSTTVQLIKLLRENNHQLSEDKAMEYALLIQKTKNFSYHIMKIDSSGSDADKIVATLMQKLVR